MQHKITSTLGQTEPLSRYRSFSLRFRIETIIVTSVTTIGKKITPVPTIEPRVLSSSILSIPFPSADPRKREGGKKGWIDRSADLRRAREGKKKKRKEKEKRGGKVEEDTIEEKTREEVVLTW